MAAMTTMTSAADAADPRSCLGAGGELLPTDPFRSLRVRFGMLLGEDDFTTIGAYHRGKGWLHAAWLHRQGAVWGLGVEPDLDKGEIRVRPGLAIDGLGREVHLDVPMCVNVGAWLDQRGAETAKSHGRPAGERELPDWAVRGGDGRVTFPAHVVIRFDGCLDRQVPSLSEPCDGANQTTTYSRVVERAVLTLRPGLAPERTDPLQNETPALPPLLPYHRLRLLFGLEPPRKDESDVVLPGDQAVLDARADVAAALPADRAATLLGYFRKLAALDEIDLAPAATAEGEDPSRVPVAEPGELVLAEIAEVALSGAFEAWTLLAPADAAGIDPTVRFAHVATSTIQELLCGAACCVAEGKGKSALSPADSGQGGAGQSSLSGAGPSVDPASVVATPKRITFSTDAALAPASVTPGAFAVTAFDPGDGWSALDVKDAALSQGGTKVTVTLKEELRGRRVRLIARGTGPRPILGADYTPLGAAAGDASDGHDFVFMIERS